MKTRSIKRVAGAAAGAAVAVSTLAALAPVHAGATVSDPFAAIIAGGGVMNIQDAAYGGVAPKVNIHNGANSSVILVDSDWAIHLTYAPDCVLGSSGDADYPYRATCSNVAAATVVKVIGTPQKDVVSVNTPGHASDVATYDGPDEIHGSAAQHDEFRAGGGADQLWVENGDLAGCGANADNTGPDGAVDTVTYNGTPTFQNCKTGGATPDKFVFSNKA